jgi:hypothetical protein
MPQGGVITDALGRRRERRQQERAAFQAQLQADRDEALATADKFAGLAEKAAQSGASRDDLERFRVGAVAALRKHGLTLDQNRAIATRLGADPFSISQLPAGEDFIAQQQRLIDARISAATLTAPNPQRAGQQAGRQAVAQAETTAGRELTPEERTRLAEVEAEGGGSFGGSSMRAQSANIVLELANKFRKNEALTDEEKDRYSLAYAELNAPRMIGSATTGFEFVESRPDPRFPRPEQLGATPIPGSEPAARPGAQVIPPRRSPEQAGRLALMQGGLQNARTVRDQIIRPDGSVNRQLMTTMIFDAPGTEGRTVRSQFEDAIAARLRIETGAAATPAEVQNLADRFLPRNLDNDETVTSKLTRLVEFFETSLSAVDPELFDTLKARNPDTPDAPADEPDATFEGFDTTTGFPIFKRPDGSRFMEAQ